MRAAPDVDSVLAAVGDPMRRRILEMLRAGELPVGELARRLPILRPAVSKHLGVLAEAGLVRHRAVGTRHLYAVDPAGVEVARGWFDALWDEALGAFATYVDAARPDRTGGPDRTGPTTGVGPGDEED